MTLRLKPRLTPGVITALTLATIVAVWATVLLLSANAAFGTDKPTKTVPANFTTGGVGVASLDPAMVGGSLAGTVTAASNGAPLARITVELYDASQRPKFVTAVATGATARTRSTACCPAATGCASAAAASRIAGTPTPDVGDRGAGARGPAEEAARRLDQAMPGGPGELTTTVVTVDGSAVAGDGRRHWRSTSRTPRRSRSPARPASRWCSPG